MASIFDGYRIQSNAKNEITIQVATDALAGVLKSAMSSNGNSGGGGGVPSFEIEEVVMKLAKKNDTAILTFDVGGSTMLGRRMSVKHDVKIEVLKPGDVERLKEPMCPQPDVFTLFSTFNATYSNNLIHSRRIYFFHLLTNCARSWTDYDRWPMS